MARPRLPSAGRPCRHSGGPSSGVRDGMTSTLERLIAAVSRENAIDGEGASAYTVVDRVPRIALFPNSLEATCAVMAAAHAEDLAVAPFGGGTQIDLGAPPTRLDVVLVTR